MRLFVLVLSSLVFSLNLHAMGGNAPKPMAGTEITWVDNLSAKKQETSSWCWAAATQMVLSGHLKNTPSQCENVSRALSTNCCAKPTPVDCLQGQWPSKILRSYGLQVKVQTETNFDAVVREVKNQRPVLLVANPAGTDHAFVAYGTFVNKKGQENLVIWDPYTNRSSNMRKKKHIWDRAYLAR
jgi:hypothetical protein